MFRDLSLPQAERNPETAGMLRGVPFTQIPKHRTEYWSIGMNTDLILAIVVAVIVVAVVLLVATRMQRQTGRFSVTLPEGWYQMPDEKPLAYRPKGEDTGTLQISLNPPFKRRSTSGEDAEKTLVELVDGLSMDLGERVALSHEQGASGIMATALYKNDKQELVQFWFIPTEVTIFGTYIMGKPENAEEEFAQAAQIMRTAKIQ